MQAISRIFNQKIVIDEFDLEKMVLLIMQIVYFWISLTQMFLSQQNTHDHSMYDNSKLGPLL